MTIRLIIFSCLLIVSKTISATIPNNMEDAKAWCDSTAIDNVEGIWYFIDDETTVLIHRAEFSHAPSYSIKILENHDGSLIPGTKLGDLQATAKNNEYKMTLFTLKEKGFRLKKSRACKASLSSDGYSMMFKPLKPNIRFIFSPTMILPSFWRLLRISSNVSNETSTSGFIKIYPSYDGNGSSKFQPRVL